MTKLQSKNRGNKRLCDAIDQLIIDLEQIDSAEIELLDVRPDADKVHTDFDRIGR